MSKRNDLRNAWRGLKAQRDKIRMAKVNRQGVLNSKYFHLI